MARTPPRSTPFTAAQLEAIAHQLEAVAGEIRDTLEHADPSQPIPIVEAGSAETVLDASEVFMRAVSVARAALTNGSAYSKDEATPRNKPKRIRRRKL